MVTSRQRGTRILEKVITRAFHARGGMLYLPNERTVFAQSLKQALNEESSTKIYELGTKLVVEDWTFRYALLGASNVAQGKVVQTAAPNANHANRPMEAADAAALAATLDPVTDNIAADDYNEGYLLINDANGEGQTLRIDDTGAAAATGSVFAALTLRDKLRKALTSASEGSLIQNKWKNLIVAPGTTLTGRCVGVTIMDVTAAYYAWIATRGPHAVLTAGTAVIGANAVSPTAVAGAAGPATAATEHVIGQFMSARADTEYSLVDLTLE